MLTKAAACFESHVYPGTAHAFACDARPDLFRPEAARQAWHRTCRFLDEHLGAGRLPAGSPSAGGPGGDAACELRQIAHDDGG